VSDGDGKRSRKGIFIGLVVVLVLVAAAVVTGVALATRDSDSTEERPLKATAVTGFVVIEGAKVTATGTYTGTPGGKGAVLVTLFPQGDLRKGKPVPLKGNVKVYLDGGRFSATLKGTASPLPNNAFAVKGTAKITGGTGTYEGATGSFTFDGGQETGEIVGKPKYEGTIEY
jgi:hypothetical protein